MYNKDFLPWEHYPKTLVHSEIMEPLKVVDDFFSSDSLAGHCALLKKWRFNAVNDKVFTDKNRSLGNLLFEYDLVLKLLEAVFLLYCYYNTNSYKWKNVSEEQLNHEKEEWGDELANLSEKEWRNPYKAVRQIFKDIPPQQYRDFLHDWLHSAFYKKADLGAFNAFEIVTVYENILKLYSTAWLIHNRENNKAEQAPSLEKLAPVNLPQLTGIRDINPNPTLAKRSLLDKLKNLILERFPCVQMIIYLASHEPSDLTYLLILINDDEKIPEHQVSNKIEDHCQHISKVHAIVHKSNSAKEALNIGRRFWSTVMDKGFRVYQSSGLVLPGHHAITNNILLERANFNWQRWGVQGKSLRPG